MFISSFILTTILWAENSYYFLLQQRKWRHTITSAPALPLRFTASQKGEKGRERGPVPSGWFLGKSWGGVTCQKQRLEGPFSPGDSVHVVGSRQAEWGGSKDMATWRSEFQWKDKGLQAYIHFHSSPRPVIYSLDQLPWASVSLFIGKKAVLSSQGCS